jgi:hypothetical protein
MGLFGNKTPALDRLCSHAESIGTAVGKVSIGMMPPDFVEAVVDGSRNELATAFSDASNEVGRQKAIKKAQSYAEMTAGIWAESGGAIAKRNASSQASVLIEEILMTMM